MMAGTGTTSKLKGARKERKEGFDDDVDAAVAAPAVEPTTTTNQAPRRFIGTAAFEFSAEEGELSLKKDDKVIKKKKKTKTENQNADENDDSDGFMRRSGYEDVSLEDYFEGG